MKNTILFVDDELINLFVLEKRFETDYNVLTAESAEDALKVVEENKSSLNAIISDLRMPGMDGLEFINQVKPNILDIPCFLLTGYDFTDQINDAIKSSKIHYLFKKPFDYIEIDTKLKEVL
ncbi:response regulator [Ekhidna sp.]|uniref:response regulator n=1 Tax=Ekhidna sp. TaxID=2608089 RepID=UPI003299B045